MTASSDNPYATTQAEAERVLAQVLKKAEESGHLPFGGALIRGSDAKRDAE